jgi:lipopolysaccharide export system protein LptC
MFNRFVALALVILSSALAVNWILEDSPDQEKASKRNDPDLYMLGATISQYDADGELQHTLGAARLTHFPLTDLTTLKSPVIALGPSGETANWDISSQEGRILSESVYREEIIELWEQVLVEQTAANDRFILIQTSSLTVYPEREYAETDDKVYIDNETGRTTAAGMKAFLDTGRFQFYSSDSERVTTIFLPN